MENNLPILPLVIMLALCVLMIASMWTVFAKANEPGWAAIIPIYNTVVLLKIAGKPVWWLVLFIIPGVGFIAAILTFLSFAKSYGKGAGFGIGLAFLTPIFLPMLAFGDAKYQGPAG